MDAMASGADLDRYQTDSGTTVSHSSPISVARTPSYSSTVAHMQHHAQFAKLLDGACSDLDDTTVVGSLNPYHTHVDAGFEVVPHDPFGLDASLFSI